MYDPDEKESPEQSGKKAKAICRRLKLSNQIVRQTGWLVETVKSLLTEHSADRDISLAQLKRMMASDSFDELLMLCKAVAPQRAYRQLRKRSQQIDPKKISPKPLINGQDLLALGIQSGPQLGRCLAATYEAQLNEVIKTKAQARKFVRDWLGRS